MIRIIYSEFRDFIAVAVSLIGIGAALVGVSPAALGSIATKLDPLYLLAAFTLLSGSMLMTFARFFVAARTMGIPLDKKSAWSAFVGGQVAGLLPFGVVAQAAGRTALLSAFPGSAPKITLLTLLERLVALGSLAALGGAGLTVTIGWSAVDLGTTFWEQVSVWAAGTGASLVLVGSLWRTRILDAVRTTGRAIPLAALAWLAGSSLLAHLLTLAAYLAVLEGSQSGLSVLEASSAIMVVMLAASVPIGIAGWGIREFAAVVVLGALGVGQGVALVTSMAVGILSVVVVAGMSLGGLAVAASAKDRTSPARAPHQDHGLDLALATISCLMVAALIPFQAQLSIAGSSLSLNGADLFALIGLVLLAANSRNIDVPPPLRAILTAFAIMAAAIAFGILVGLVRHGPTAWALMNRGVGLVVTGSYLCLSLLAFRFAGSALLIALAQALVVAFTLAAVLEVTCEALTGLGLLAPRAVVSHLLWQGFSASANTTVVQAALALVLWAGVSARGGTSFLFRLVPPVALTAQLLLSTSRTAALVLCLVLPALALLWPPTRRPLAAGLIVGSFLCVLGPTVGQLPAIGNVFVRVVEAGTKELAQALTGPGAISSSSRNEIPASQQPETASIASLVVEAAVKPASDQERMESIKEGLRLFRDNPLVGGGIGHYITARSEAGKSALVIHSTPVWVLAEMGVLGALAFAASGTIAGAAAWRYRTQPPVWAAILAFAVWAAAGLVHDLINQRMFWLTLGILFALVHVEDPGSQRKLSQGS